MDTKIYVTHISTGIIEEISLGELCYRINEELSIPFYLSETRQEADDRQKEILD